MDIVSKQDATKMLLDVSHLEGGAAAASTTPAAGADGGKSNGSGPAASRSNKAAADRLLEVVYDDCRRLAASYLKRENSGHTLQPTALAHEVYMRLIEQERVDWKGRTHFMAIAAQAMRRLLIDHARGRDRLKRGGGWQRVALEGPSEPGTDDHASEVDVERLDKVLEELAQLDERQAKIVEMRFLAGMTVEEVAEALGVSKRTVEGDWTMARAWLRKRLSEDM
jgi:RNA polymerase sigma factor (TIGR02999 family)